jgi:hypothetical protein
MLSSLVALVRAGLLVTPSTVPPAMR